MQAFLNTQLQFRTVQWPRARARRNKRGAACEDSAAEHVEDTTTNQA